jgi:hypothetical protein
VDTAIKRPDNQIRLLDWFINRSARSKKFTVLEDWDRSPGVLGTVACAAAPRAALSGVAGTGVGYPLELCEPKLIVAEGKAVVIAGIEVLIGPGNEGPPPETIVGLPKNRGAVMREVIEDKLGGPIMPELFAVKWLHGESLMARLASLTVLCRGFMSCFTSKL